MFIGYALNSSVYGFVVHKSKISTITVGTSIESRNAIFLENTFPCKDKEEVPIHSETRIEDEATSSKTVDEATSSKFADDEPKSRKRVRPDPSDAVLIRGSRVRAPKTFGPAYITFMLDEEPTSIKVAFYVPDGLHWREAVERN